MSEVVRERDRGVRPVRVKFYWARIQLRTRGSLNRDLSIVEV